MNRNFWEVLHLVTMPQGRPKTLQLEEANCIEEKERCNITHHFVCTKTVRVIQNTREARHSPSMVTGYASQWNMARLHVKPLQAPTSTPNMYRKHACASYEVPTLHTTTHPHILAQYPPFPPCHSSSHATAVRWIHNAKGRKYVVGLASEWCNFLVLWNISPRHRHIL